ncbi:VOC family protein [Pedomonas sp. V897]|uniref:VOC family protein n=1 Tax=Pedomonas sp. V897 TaxID=3446482 RepID=UPI003EE2DD6A
MAKGPISALGEVMQLAYVPADFDAALRYWTETMGVGPFFLFDHMTMEDFKYKGQPTDAVFSVAIAYWNDIQIELIQQHNDSPSIYKQWRDAGLDGLHHTCIVVPDLKKARAVCLEAGATILQEGRAPGVEALYVDTGGGPGSILELIEIAEETRGAFDTIRNAARDWDGTNPLRPIGG